MSEYTEAERKLARTVINDDVCRLLEKVLTEKYQAEETSEQNVLALNNARYGEIMKVNFMVRRHAISALDRLKKLAATPNAGITPAKAPK